MRKTYRWRANRSIREIAKSAELEAVLMKLAEPVLEQAKQDPNADYVASLQLRAFRSSGTRGRVSANITAAPTLGARVEAKRGTLGRAIGHAGT